MYVKRDAIEHVLQAERFFDIFKFDHVAMSPRPAKILSAMIHDCPGVNLCGLTLFILIYVGKIKSDTVEIQKLRIMMDSEEFTTARVVAQPTPSDPPNVDSPQ